MTDHWYIWGGSFLPRKAGSGNHGGGLPHHDFWTVLLRHFCLTMGVILVYSLLFFLDNLGKRAYRYSDFYRWFGRCKLSTIVLFIVSV